MQTKYSFKCEITITYTKRKRKDNKRREEKGKRSESKERREKGVRDEKIRGRGEVRDKRKGNGMR